VRQILGAQTPVETRTATASSRRSQSTDAALEHLVVVLDRARPLEGGARHVLANIECVTIGRGRSRSAERTAQDRVRTLRLALADERISSLHARIERTADGWRLTDCGSKNGTRINRRPSTTAVLADGDVVEVGNTLLRYRLDVPTPVGTPGDLDSSELEGLPRTIATLLPTFARDVLTLARLAETDVPVLLLGETGTGKEVLARAIHEQSGRSGPFVAVNSGAIPATLVESLLFGHKRGAFSGALNDQLGFLRAASDGTLFFDEIGDLAPAAQAALLRVIQEREVVPLGGTHPVSVNVRFLSATHRPLESLTKSGAFREDLMARIAGFVHHLPPLRDRIDDVGVLLGALLRKIAGKQATEISLGADASHELLAYAWPLNVRELEQRLRAAVALAPKGRIEVAHLWKEGPPRTGRPSDLPVRARSPAEDALHAQLLEHLTAQRGNVTQVGTAMGKSRTQIQRWLRRLGIDAERFRR
jgi:transcriptional regulator of acetoin/glycerol metabolism